MPRGPVEIRAPFTPTETPIPDLSSEPWRALVARFPGLLDVLPHIDLCSEPPLFPEFELMELYKRYCGEWDRVPLAPDLARLAA